MLFRRTRARRSAQAGRSARGGGGGRWLVGLALAWAGLAVVCTQLPPRWWWPTAFGAMTLPAALGLNALLLLLFGLRRRRLALVPLAVLVLGWGYAQRGFAVNAPLADAPPARAVSALPTVGADSVADPFRVLSHNVRIFNYYKSLADPDYASSKTLVEWLADHPADVLCLQEYYNQVKRWDKYPFFQTTRTIGRGRYAFVSVAYPFKGQEFGLAIFSRFPIVRRGIISFGRLTQNHAQWADLRRPAHAGRPADTVRVYNVHFQSMSLDESAIVTTTQRRAWLDAPGLRLLRRFRDGAVRRSQQADTVVAHIRACRLPVVVCGDFNDVPYSYTYSVFNNFMANAHQSVGTGVGATYNGRLPGLRLDSQFSTPDRLEPVWVKLHEEIALSDHYPLEAVYQVKRRR
ncbi:MAG: endonuclease/exonuclease/phosphatase family protein [Hymenobacteraceae bacterium]|nr:endonuclease/exonuclease/phosphatase family protein [Hymenobacteraceae bacterium]